MVESVSYRKLALNLSSVAEPGHSSFSPSALSGVVDGREMRVQVVRIVVDIQQPGDDLALGRVIEQEVHRGELVMDIVVGVELAQRDLRAVVLLDDLHRCRARMSP